MKNKLVTIGVLVALFVWSTAFGGYTKVTTDFSDIQYQKDVQKEQVFNIPDDAVYLKVAVGRTLLPAKLENIIVVDTQVWSDEINWGNHCGFTTDGGDRLDEAGKIATESYNECNLYPGKNRKIKVTVKTKYDLQTKASVTIGTYSLTVLDMLSANRAEAAIAHVQSSANGNNCGSVTSCAVSYPGNTTAGSLLVGTCRYGTNGRTITYSDAQTNTYALGDEHVQTNDSNGTLLIYYAMNTNGGSTNSTTCAISGAASIMRATVSEFSGIATTGALDQAVSAEGSSNAPASGALTAASDGSLYFVASFAGSSTDLTAGTDYTIRSEVPVTSERLATESYIQTTAASHDGTFSLSGSVVWAASLVIFKPLSVAAPTASTPKVIIQSQVIIQGAQLII